MQVQKCKAPTSDGASGTPAPKRGRGAKGRAAKTKEKKMTNSIDYHQPLGLDIGTSRIVVARNANGEYEYESQLNAFLTLPYSKLAASLLERENVFHEVKGSEILVAGNDAQKFAEVFHAETRRP